MLEYVKYLLFAWNWTEVKLSRLSVFPDWTREPPTQTPKNDDPGKPSSDTPVNNTSSEPHSDMSESQSSSHLTSSHHTSSHHTSPHHGETSKSSKHHDTEHNSKHATEPAKVTTKPILTSKPSKTKTPHEHVSGQRQVHSEPDQKATSKAKQVTNKHTDSNNGHGHVTDDSRKTWTFSNLTEGPRDYLNSKSIFC